MIRVLPLLGALAALALPVQAQTTVIPAFQDETASAGIAHSFTGEWEFMVGGGAAVFDCDADSRPDIYIAGGTTPAALFRNRTETGAALAFERSESGAELTDVSGAWPLDIDGDGNIDLALMRVGENVLMRGTGDCRFERANEAWGFDGGDDWSASFAATWEPGATWPTLAVGNYIDRAEEAFPWGSCTDNMLHRPAPEGGSFAAPLPLKPSFCALSILFTDWKRTGVRDLRVSNDREYYKGGQEQLWHLPPGEPPRLYTEAEGWQRLRIWGMGIAERDITGDGLPEYYLTSMADNKLQTLTDPATGKPVYSDVALKRGVTAHRPYTGGDLNPSTAWHAQFEDVNNDGLPDLFVAKGNVWNMPDFAQRDPNNLLLLRPDGTFEEAGDRAGVASFEQSRGGALADFNGDGLVDLLVVNRNSPVQIWRNTTTGAGNWLAIDPAMEGANRNAVGAIIELRTPAGVQTRDISVGGGHGGGVLVPWHFGLGTATEAEVRVIWPDGTAGAWTVLAAGQVHRLTPE